MSHENIIPIGFLGAGGIGGKAITDGLRMQSFPEFPIAETLKITQVLVRDPNKNRPYDIPQKLITADANKILKDPSIKIVVSLLGDEKSEHAFILEALKKKKFVVTANKEVIAKHGSELIETAKENGVGIFFEASVAGGIQIIDNLQERYLPNKFTVLLGIVNGTTNYILTQMAERKLEFGLCLEEAKKLGFAEPDPTNDVEGFDSAYKLAILTSLAFRKGWVKPESIHAEGITKITQTDLKYASELGYVVKLIAQAKVENDQIEAWVAPTLIPKNHLLADINNSFNGLFLLGYPIGEVKLQGRGAGPGPTSSSIWSDIFKAAEHVRNGTRPKLLDTTSPIQLRPFGETINRQYIRMTVLNKPGVLGKICTILGEKHEVGINAIDQPEGAKRDGLAEIVILTDPSEERNLAQAIEELSKEEIVSKISSVLRVINNE